MLQSWLKDIFLAGRYIRMRVLLVEDNRRLCAALKAQLEKGGYAVDVTLDGRKGLAYAESTPYDPIILDIMLPNKDGLAVCRELRDSAR